jgi:hypothetical protein
MPHFGPCAGPSDVEPMIGSGPAVSSLTSGPNRVKRLAEMGVARVVSMFPPEKARLHQFAAKRLARKPARIFIVTRCSGHVRTIGPMKDCASTNDRTDLSPGANAKLRRKAGFPDHIGDRLPYAYQDKGEQSVKNIARPVRVYALRPPAMADASGSRVPVVSSRRRRAVLAPIAIMAAEAALVIAVLVWAIWTNPSTSLAVTAATSVAPPLMPPRLSIVVLPFANFSNESGTLTLCAN